jgi:simple sugar transport system permease protein
LRNFVRSASLYLGLVVLFVVGTFVSPQFLTIDNQRDVFWQVSSNGIVAVGMTMVILTAGIDLSVGSLLSVCSVICAMLLMERTWTDATSLAIPSTAVVAAAIVAGIVGRVLRGKARQVDVSIGKRLVPWVVGLVVAAAIWGVASSRVSPGFGTLGVLLLVPPIGIVLGALNGALISKGKLQPFIVTLAMMVSAVGLAKYIAGSGGRIHPVYFADPAAKVDGAPHSFELLASNLSVAGKDLIPVPGIFFAVIAIVAWVLLGKLRFGRYIYAVGGNEETARLSGINTDRVKTLVYAISGFLCAVAAVLYCAQYQQGKADAGAGRELDAIAAVVIGGTSLMGGRGGIGGTVVGVFIFGYLSNILNLRGVPTEFQAILKGVIIIVAVLLQEGILARWIGDAYRMIKTAQSSKPAA